MATPLTTMENPALSKPLPKPNADSVPFWEACNREELTFQRCGDCGHAQFYPRALCVKCHSRRLTWEKSGGRGEVYSFTELHRAAIPSFQADVPYLVVLLEMAEGFRLLCNVHGPAGGIAIGTKGRIVFEDRGAQKVPKFRPDA